MTYALGGLLLAAFLLTTMYVDFEISFTRNENGAFSFRFGIGMKKV